MADRKFVLLDGGMGRELQRRNLIKTKTIWSGFALLDCPEIVQEVHEAFIAAGAEVITTSNYGIVPNFLAQEGLSDRLAELTQIAVALAEAARAAAGRPLRIAGSLPPLNTSYRPDLVGPDAEVEASYRELAALLAPGVDLLICETMSSAREAHAAVAAASVGKPVWVAWSLDDAADGCLRSGETVAEAHAALEGLPVEAFLLNCCSAESISRALPELRALTDKPIGAYANSFQPLAKEWRAAGAGIIGGCCGIGPEYIELLNRELS